ncbi:hypothetical protein [Kitasatospora sp. NPDC089509]|uniref:hypothetical protein n=1 Tax=Kitasatospora sp. NPDC089509 TaxID=3364079 RepID=UPI00382D92A9
MSTEPATLLTYVLDPRFLSAATQGGTVTLIGRNCTGGDVTCNAVTLSLPCGTAPTDLTAQDAQALSLATGDGWDVDPKKVGKNLELTVSAAGGKVLENGDTVELRIANLDINGIAKPVQLTVMEEVKGLHTATRTLDFDKTPAGFVLTDFRPDPYIIDPEHTTTDLTWRTTLPAGTTASYALRCTGYAHPWDVTGRTTQRVAPPSDATCVLTATVKPVSGATTRADLSTFLLVAGPAVAARTLTADTTVKLLGRTDPGNTGIPGYTSIDVRQALVTGDTFVAHTDGLLLADVRSIPAGREVHLHLALADAPGHEPLYRMTTVADTRRRTATLPVPAGSAVTISTTSPGSPADEPWYVVALDWRPFGGGRLTAAS